MSNTSRAITVSTAILLGCLGPIGVAHAEQGTKSPRITETAPCGSIATKIKVSGEDTGAEVEYELDQNVNGRSWSLTLKRNGTTLRSATRTTKAPSGSLHWRVVTSGPSAGTFSVTATRGAKTCTIKATL